MESQYLWTISKFIMTSDKLCSPYFMSVARNSHLTNKSEADGAFTLPPLLCQCYLTGKGKSK